MLCLRIFHELRINAMKSISLNAYAKINLFLNITGKRPDGYHTLETVMHTISLCDEVCLEKSSGDIEIICTDSSIPCDERNIAHKCAKAFFEKTGITGTGVRITITKRIPSQAGMGGGSADGAAVLKGMNSLFGTGLSENELCGIGVKIGADIPFCIVGGCGYCTGIGEDITPLPPFSGTVLIGKGSEGVSTKEAFAAVDTVKVTVPDTDVRKAFECASDISEIAPCCFNIFEHALRLDEAEQIKAIMQADGAVCACMTGSGSAVFGLFSSESAAEKAEKALKAKGFFSRLSIFV